MQYLVSVIDDTSDSATSEEMADIDVFNEKLQADGHWVFAGGLGTPSTATVIDGRGAEPVLTDGPFVESKEWLAGFWVIEAPDLDAALKLVAQMRSAGRAGSVVTLLCDGGERYAHTYYSDAWLAEQGIDVAPYLATLEKFAETGVWVEPRD